MALRPSRSLSLVPVLTCLSHMLSAACLMPLSSRGTICVNARTCGRSGRSELSCTLQDSIVACVLRRLAMAESKVRRHRHALAVTNEARNTRTSDRLTGTMILWATSTMTTAMTMTWLLSATRLRTRRRHHGWPPALTNQPTNQPTYQTTNRATGPNLNQPPCALPL